MRFDRLALPWRVALAEAWQAFREGNVPIGAAVAAADGTILSYAHNHIHGGAPDGQVGGGQLAHAELNALILLGDLSRDILHQATLYTTMEPCPLCLGALYMSSVRTLRYACRDGWAGSANLLGKTPYLALKPVRAHGPERALEDIPMVWMAAHELEHCIVDRESAVWQKWMQDSPRALMIGENIRVWLRQQADQGAAVGDIFDQISALMRDPEFP